MESARELEYHLLSAQSLGFLNEPSYEQLAHEVTTVKRMLAAFIH
jgi:four helix bundle protein